MFRILTMEACACVCVYSPFPPARWDEALSAYEGKLCVTQHGSQEYLTALLGKMRCLASLAEWEKLSALCRCVAQAIGKLH